MVMENVRPATVISESASPRSGRSRAHPSRERRAGADARRTFEAQDRLRVAADQLEGSLSESEPETLKQLRDRVPELSGAIGG